MKIRDTIIGKYLKPAKENRQNFLIFIGEGLKQRQSIKPSYDG